MKDKQKFIYDYQCLERIKTYFENRLLIKCLLKYYQVRFVILKDSLMKSISLVKHADGAPGLRIFGLGPSFMPMNGIKKLQLLFNQNTLWAKDRKRSQIKKMLENSNVIITLWFNSQLVGFGRATTDQVYRAVLWDIVISSKVQGTGLGKLIIESLLEDEKIKSVEKIYLMTTNSKDFYTQLGFEVHGKQTLMLKKKNY